MRVLILVFIASTHFAVGCDCAGINQPFTPDASTADSGTVDASVGPVAPSFVRAEPASPSSTSTPRIVGLSSSDTVTVRVFSDTTCTALLGSGPKSDWETTGLLVTLPFNATTTLWGQAVDTSGSTSGCAQLTTYTHDSLGPAAPTALGTTPMSPDRSATTPFVHGTPSADTVSLRIYDDGLCASLVGSGTAAEFSSGGITATLPANTASTLHVIAADALGNTSSCADATLPYTHDAVAPDAVTAVTHAAANSSLTDSPLISWTGGGTDGLSGFSRFEYSIGSSAGDSTILGWTAIGAARAATATGLTLVSGATYFANVRVVDLAGNVSTVTSSTGWQATGGPASLVFTTQPSPTAVAGMAFAQQPVIEVRDSAGTRVSGTGPLIALSPFLNAACTIPSTGLLAGPANPTQATAGQATFSGLNLQKAETVFLRAATGALSACSSAITVGAAPATRIVLSGPAPVTTGSCAASYRLTTSDLFGNTTPVSSTQTFSLTSTGSGAFFSNSQCLASSASVTVLTGTSSATYFFRNDVTETVTQTGSLSGFTDGTLSVTSRSPVASFVFGQPDFTTNRNLSIGVSEITAVMSDGTRLFAAEDNPQGMYDRILVWNVSPASNFQARSLTLGAPSNDQFVSQNLSEFRGVFSDGTHLIASDRGNNQVMVWPTLPTTSGQAPTIVLGPGFGNGGAGATGLQLPTGVASDGTRLFVADEGNHRVLIWNTFPTVNQQAASVVLGQADMNANLPNRGGAVDAAGLNHPGGILVQAGKLLVADTDNNRILIWNSIPSVNGTPANVVVGQPNFNSNAAALTASGLLGPRGLAFDGTHLVVADTLNNRVLLYPSLPTSNGAAAIRELGQVDMVSNGSNRGGSATGGTLFRPSGVTVDGAGRLFVADTINHRILSWNSTPVADGQSADGVQGQADLTTTREASAGAVTASTFGGRSGLGAVFSASSVCTDGVRVFASDITLHRVLVWNARPTQSNQSPDFVLGQPDFVSGASNSGGIAIGFDSPSGIDCDASHLAVVDQGHDRVLIWNRPITSNHQAPDVVIGQPDFLSLGDGLTASKLSGPSAVSIQHGKLAIADTRNWRVLLWNSIPPTGAPADLVMGQPDFVTGAATWVTPTLQTMVNPTHVLWDGTHLVVTDYFNQRRLIWNSWPVVNREAAATTNSRCPGTTAFSTGTSLWAGWFDWNGRGRYGRICVWNSFPTISEQRADRALGQPSIFGNDPLLLNDRSLSGNVSVSGSGNFFVVLDNDYFRMTFYDHEP